MSNRLRARRKRARLPSSDCRPDSLPVVLELIFTSLMGRALPSSLDQELRKGDDGETSAPASSPIKRDIRQSPSRPAWRRLNFPARRLLGPLISPLHRWRQRARDREYLRGLSDRMLKDLGLSRALVESDFSKSFWRD